AHVVGADVDRALRFDLPGGRDDRREVALLDDFGRDDLARLPVEAQVGNDERNGEHDDAEANQPFLRGRLHPPPNASLTAAITTPMVTSTASSPTTMGVVRRR